MKDRDEPNDRQGAVYKIKYSDCQTSYISETGRNLNTRLTEHKQATRNGDASNRVAVCTKMAAKKVTKKSVIEFCYSNEKLLL